MCLDVDMHTVSQHEERPSRYAILSVYQDITFSKRLNYVYWIYFKLYDAASARER